MEQNEAQLLAERLMRKHGLNDWSYGINNRKKALGLCFSRLRRIELSRNFIYYNDEETITETLLHEIAHAIVGTEHGHDQIWKEMAERIGAKPLRTTSRVVMPPGRWQATCPGCGLLFTRYRRPKYITGNSCLRCGPELGLLTYAESSTFQTQAQQHRALLKRLNAVAAHMVEAEPEKEDTRTPSLV